MSLARITLILIIVTKLPSNYNSLRITLFNMLWTTTKIISVKNIFVTLNVLMICCSV